MLRVSYHSKHNSPLPRDARCGGRDAPLASAVRAAARSGSLSTYAVPGQATEEKRRLTPTTQLGHDISSGNTMSPKKLTN